MIAFEQALRHVLEAEGGFVDNPADRGGPTNYGVTLATLQAHRGAPCGVGDVRTLTRSEATAIYLTRYWQPTGLDQLTSPAVATVLFDQTVNRGPGPAVRMLQTALQALGAAGVTVDGRLGPETAAKANAASERALTLKLIILAQSAYLDLWHANPAQAVFLRGWMARTWRLFDVL